MTLRYETMHKLRAMLEQKPISQHEDPIHQLFEQNDYMITALLHRFAVYQYNKDIKHEYLTWSVYACELLDQVINDVSLARKVKHWDPEIHRQFIDLTFFLGEYFKFWIQIEEALQKHISEQSKAKQDTQHSHDNDGTAQTQSKSGSAPAQPKLAAKLKNSEELKRYTTNGVVLLPEMKDGLRMKRQTIAMKLKRIESKCNPNSGESISEVNSSGKVTMPDRVSTATLRELLLRNEIINRRDQIRQAIDGISQEGSLSSSILRIYRHFSRLQRKVDEIKPPLPGRNSISTLPSKQLDMNEKNADGSTDSDDEDGEDSTDDASTDEDSTATEKTSSSKLDPLRLTWLSDCLIIVVDTAARITVTGGTRPTCHNFPPVNSVGARIKAQRLGEKFMNIINICSEDFTRNAQQRTKAKGSATPLEYHAQITDLGQSHAQRQLPASSESGKVHSFACRGRSFKRLAPCIRCQAFYPSWVMDKRPTEQKIMNEPLSLPPHLNPSEFRPDMEWTYCAESVAAVKLFLLRNGRIGLV